MPAPSDPSGPWALGMPPDETAALRLALLAERKRGHTALDLSKDTVQEQWHTASVPRCWKQRGTPVMRSRATSCAPYGSYPHNPDVRGDAGMFFTGGEFSGTTGRQDWLGADDGLGSV